MKFDITRLPVGETLIGLTLVATVATFIAAFAFVGGGEGKEGASLPETPAAETPPPTESPAPGGAVEVAMVPTIKFDKAEVTVPAGQPVTLRADNKDTAIPHNWAAYTDDSAKELIAGTDVCVAPCLEEITFDPPEPGEYFFQCDVHPQVMTGKLIVQ